MGGFSNNSSTGGGGGGVGPAGKKSDGSYGSKKDAKKTSNRNEFSSAAKKAAKFVATGGTVTGAILRSLTSNSKKKNKDGYGGEAYGYNEADEKRDYKENPFTNGSGNDNQPQGIELAKKVAEINETILSPAKIQAEAANKIKGPTTVEMSADEISLANKRKGRKQTNITAKATLAKNYKLSEKTLLG
jgi:hypothetical protein